MKLKEMFLEPDRKWSDNCRGEARRAGLRALQRRPAVFQAEPDEFVHAGNARAHHRVGPAPVDFDRAVGLGHGVRCKPDPRHQALAADIVRDVAHVGIVAFAAVVVDLEDQIRRGEFGELLAWLVENVHQYGRKYEPQELVQRVTGSKIDPAPYLRYLERKYGEIYGL